MQFGIGATNIGYIKERKQFTTSSQRESGDRMVLQIQDISKNESNSQRNTNNLNLQLWCYKYRIYQRTKAIHNERLHHLDRVQGATNIGYIKERKQFTTTEKYLKQQTWCYKYRIYQRTKAIHNPPNPPKIK